HPELSADAGGSDDVAGSHPAGRGNVQRISADRAGAVDGGLYLVLVVVVTHGSGDAEPVRTRRLVDRSQRARAVVIEFGHDLAGVAVTHQDERSPGTDPERAATGGGDGD